MLKNISCFSIINGKQKIFTRQLLRQQLSYQSKKVRDYPFEKFHEIEVTIEDITNQGQGIGRVTLENGEKWVVMVPTVLKGEKVRAKILRNDKNYSETDLVEVITPSLDRITPPCPYYAMCGGCQYQHMPISTQRKLKQDQVKNLLHRIGGFPETIQVNEVMGTEEVYGYRTKITPHSYKYRKSQQVLIGFHRRGTRSVVDIPQCMIATPAINQKYQELRTNSTFLSELQAKEKTVTFLFREGNNQEIITNNKEFVHQTVDHKLFTFIAGEFFQNNPYVMQQMIDYVKKHCQTSIKHTQTSQNTLFSNLIDTYCGSGLFGITLSHLFQVVYGIETSQKAIEMAKINAKQNSIENIHLMSGDASHIFAQVEHLNPNETIVLIDPPRTGCDTSFLQQLQSFLPQKIIYISCDPATQARDAKEIVSFGYQIIEITPFDMFPQTRHIENIMIFER